MNNNQQTPTNPQNVSTSTNSQTGKTQVFILSPDILKKLGLTSKIQNLKTENNTSIQKSPIQEQDNINAETENKQIIDSKDATKQNVKIDENSVKSKLLSKLVTKLENEQGTSSSTEDKTDRQIKFSNQINLKEIKLPENIAEKKVITSRLELQEHTSKGNELNKIITEENKECKIIMSKMNTVHNTNNEETNIFSSKNTQTDKCTNVTFINKSIKSTNLFANTLSNENKNECSLGEMDDTGLKVTLTDNECPKNTKEYTHCSQKKKSDNLGIKINISKSCSGRKCIKPVYENNTKSIDSVEEAKTHEKDEENIQKVENASKKIILIENTYRRVTYNQGDVYNSAKIKSNVPINDNENKKSSLNTFDVKSETDEFETIIRRNNESIKINSLNNENKIENSRNQLKTQITLYEKDNLDNIDIKTNCTDNTVRNKNSNDCKEKSTHFSSDNETKSSELNSDSKNKYQKDENSFNKNDINKIKEKNKIEIIKTQKNISDNTNVKQSKDNMTPKIIHTVIPKGNKRKIEDTFSDEELISPVRKSGRRRKLSTFHTDFVTELKLHDGSDNQITHKSKKLCKKITHVLNSSKIDPILKNKVKEIPDNIKKDITKKNRAVKIATSDISSQNHCKTSNDKILTINDTIKKSVLDARSNNNIYTDISSRAVIKSQETVNIGTSNQSTSKKHIIIHENILLKSSPNCKSVPNKADLEEVIKSVTGENSLNSKHLEIKHLNKHTTSDLEIKTSHKSHVGKKSKPADVLNTPETKSVKEIVISEEISTSLENMAKPIPTESQNVQCTSIEKTADITKSENTPKSSLGNITLFRRRRSKPEKDRTFISSTPLNEKFNSDDSEIDLNLINVINPETVTDIIEDSTASENQSLQNKSIVEINSEVKRKRGRPRKLQNNQTILNLYESEFENADSNSKPVPAIKRKRGRPRKQIIQDATDSPGETSHSDKSDGELSDCTPKIVRGRRKKIDSDSDEDFQEKNYKPKIFKEKTVKSIKFVTCAVCNKSMLPTEWNNHTVNHNFLCWKVGEDEVDVNNRKAVENFLLKTIKNNKRFKYFTCPTCESTKKSVLGYLAHVDVCQKSEEEIKALMEPCPICDKKIMPQSMRTHVKVHEDKEEKVKKLKEEIIANQSEIRSKRKAAAKAQDLIQEVTSEDDFPLPEMSKRRYKQYKEPGSIFLTFGVIKKFKMQFTNGSKSCKFNCNFKCDDFEEMKSHLSACPVVQEEDYICKYCLNLEKNEEDMKEHVTSKHSQPQKLYQNINDNIDDSDDLEEPETFIDENVSDEEFNSIKVQKPKTLKASQEYTRLMLRVNFLAKEKGIFKDPICSYLPALKWTKDFCLENYCNNLFENIKYFASNWIPVAINEQENYLPRLKKSMSVKSYSIEYNIPNLQQQEHEWKEYELFESSLENETISIFCGGPISALAWAPTPYDVVADQYLAVSLQKDFEKTYKISEASKEFEIIQFWNFGKLEITKSLDHKPTLEFSLAHKHGMIWCMEWCPSGIYQIQKPSDSEELQKIGLLSLACADGNIPIYAIGNPNQTGESRVINIYNTKPIFKLILQDRMEKLLGRWNYQATKLTWSKGKGHNIIAGGYSNGLVCLWDLENCSPLLKSDEHGVTILKPFHSFQAHSSAVSAIILFPTADKGKRWLLTGSWDRSFKYWDLNNTSYPITIFGKRGVITDGVWISHWLCSYFAFDDVFSLGHTVTTVQNPRDFGFKQCSALASNSVVMCLSASDWANSVAQGTLAGELIATFPRTILMTYDVDKNLKCKRMMLSYNEIIDKTKQISERNDIMKSEKLQEKLVDDEKMLTKYLANNSEPYVEEPTTYEEVQNKYGIIFCDFKLNKFSSLPVESLEAVKKSSKLREVPTELYPFMSLNRVQWNPNKQAFLYVASGYQNGFVRLRCIQFMLSKYAHLYVS